MKALLAGLLLALATVSFARAEKLSKHDDALASVVLAMVADHYCPGLSIVPDKAAQHLRDAGIDIAGYFRAAVDEKHPQDNPLFCFLAEINIGPKGEGLLSVK